MAIMCLVSLLERRSRGVRICSAMDPFDSLGLPPRFELDRAELERRYRELQRQLHPDRHVHASPSQRRLALLKAIEVNEAYQTLRDDLSRAEALLALHGGQVGTDPEDPEFLMEIMELRESLGDARAAGDAGQVAELAAQVKEKQARVRELMAEDFGRLQSVPAPDALSAIGQRLGRLRYYRRFLDEVRIIEDDLGC